MRVLRVLHVTVMIGIIPTMLLFASSRSFAQPQSDRQWTRLDPDKPLVKQIRVPDQVQIVLKGISLHVTVKLESSVKPIPSWWVTPGIQPKDLSAQPAPATGNRSTGTVAGVTKETRVAPQVDADHAAPGANQSPLPSGVDQREGLYLQRIRQGDDSPEVHDWLKGLSVQQLTRMIEQVPGSDPAWQRVKRLAVETLIAEHGVSGEGPEQLSGAVVLALAEYYREKSDERCVKLYESLLSKRKTKTADPLYEIDGLVRYYGQRGDSQKVAETSLRAEKYTADKVMLACCCVDAARAYMRMSHQSGDPDRSRGYEKKANELYESVEKYGYGWSTGMALHDRASRLMHEGKHDLARKLLATPVTGLYADQIKVGLLSLLADSYYQSGDLKQAEEYARSAVAQYGSLTNPIGGVESFIWVNRSWISWLEQWRKNPIQTVQRRIILRPRIPDEKPEALLEVRSYEDIPLQISTTLRFVTIAEEASKHERSHLGGSERQTFWRSVYKVSTSLEAPKGTHEGVLRVNSPKYPDRRWEVGIIADISGVCCRPSTLFFGEVEKGRRYEIPVVIFSIKPFRIKRFSAGNHVTIILPQVEENRTEFHCNAVLEVPKESKENIMEGEFSMETNIAGQEVVRIPYFALVK